MKAPRSLQEACKYKNRRVCRAFKEGTFTGVVQRVEWASDLEEDGVISPGPVFHIL